MFCAQLDCLRSEFIQPSSSFQILIKRRGACTIPGTMRRHPVMSPSSDSGEGDLSKRRINDSNVNRYLNQKARLVRIDCGLGPSIPFGLVEEVYEHKCNSLNLHANKLQNLNIDLDPNLRSQLLYLETLLDLDVSSNSLGQQSIPTTRCNERIIRPISILSITKNLKFFNLSTNALTSLSSVFSNGSKSLELHRLKKLLLSHNKLKTVPKALFDVCPCLETLCLVANNIRTLNDIMSPFKCEQQKGNSLRNLRLQNKDGSDSNPVCHQKKYMVTLLLVLPDLDVLDEVKISREFEISTSTIIDDDTVVADFKPRKTDLDRKKHSMRPSYAERTRLDTMQLDRSLTSNHRVERQLHMKRAASTISLHKLNQIEYQVKAMSLIAQEQAQATKQLLQKNSENIVRVKEISEKCVCTSPLSLPHPAECLIPSKRTAEEFTSMIESALSNHPLQVAVLKWKLFAMTKELNEQNQKSIKVTTVMRKELLTTREDLERKHKSENQAQNLALVRKDHKICLLQTELAALQAKHQKITHRFKSKRRREIEHLAQIADSELEAIHTRYQTSSERDQAAHVKCRDQLQEVYCCCQGLETHRKGLTDALNAEKVQTKELSKQLQEYRATFAIERDKADSNYSKVSSYFLLQLFIRLCRITSAPIFAQIFKSLSIHCQNIEELKDAFKCAAKRSAADRALVEKQQRDLSKDSSIINASKDQVDKLKHSCHVKDEKVVKLKEKLEKAHRENDELIKATQMIEERQAPLLQKYDQQVSHNVDVTKQMEQERTHHQSREEILSSQNRKLNDENSEVNLKLLKQKCQNDNLSSTLSHEQSANFMSKLKAALKGKKTYKKEVRKLRQLLIHYTDLLGEKDEEIRNDASDIALMAKSLEVQRQDLAEAKEEATCSNQLIRSRLINVSNDKDEVETENKILHEEKKLLGKDSYTELLSLITGTRLCLLTINALINLYRREAARIG